MHAYVRAWRVIRTSLVFVRGVVVHYMMRTWDLLVLSTRDDRRMHVVANPFSCDAAHGDPRVLDVGRQGTRHRRRRRVSRMKIVRRIGLLMVMMI